MSKKKNQNTVEEEEKEISDSNFTQLKDMIENLATMVNTNFKKLEDRMDIQEIRMQKIEEKFSSRSSTPRKADSPINSSVTPQTILSHNISIGSNNNIDNNPLLTLNLPKPTLFDEFNSKIRAVEIKKRNSIIGDLYKFIPVDDQNRLTIKSEKHFDIRWETKTIDNFLIFMEKVVDFQTTTGEIFPNIFAHISNNIQEQVRNILKIYNQKKFTSRYELTKISMQDLIEAAEILFAPQQIDHFNQLLFVSCSNYQVLQKGTSYESTRTKLYTLKEKFLERYQFLADGTKLLQRDQCIPMNNFKSGGLLKVWMDLTPEGSRDAFITMLINHKYQDITEFLDRYFLIVEETYNMFQWTKTYKNRIGRIVIRMIHQKIIAVKMNKKMKMMS